MARVRFTATVLRFGQHGEKTGWTYFEIPPDIASKIKPGNRKSFRVKGSLDRHSISAVALIPMGGGSFIMPLNAKLRRALGKGKGASISVTLEEDKSPFRLNPDLLDCLADAPAARKFFECLPGAHQRYISKWIDSAKTAPTRARRIAVALNTLSRKQGFREMLPASGNRSAEGI